MKLRSIQLIYFKEMLDLLRDRRTIISMVIAPLAVMPLIYLGASYFFTKSANQAKEQRYRLALGQAVNLDGISASLEKAGFRLQMSDNPRRAVENRESDMGVEVSGQGQNINIRIYADLSKFESQVAGTRIDRALDQLKNRQIKYELQRAGVPEQVLTPFSVEKVNIATPAKMSGLMIGNFLGYAIVIFMLTGGMYPAIDMTAGEKERRTMEMLLSSPASREEIVLAKVLATITATIVTAILTIISFSASFYISRQMSNDSRLFGQTSQIPLDVTTFLLIILTILPMAVMAAAVIIAIATLAKSFKEAQSYLTPLLFLAIFPAMVSFLPGVKLSGAIALVPILNFSQLVKELLLGEWSWLSFTLTLVSNLVYAIVAFVSAVAIFKNEHVLFRT